MGGTSRSFGSRSKHSALRYLFHFIFTKQNGGVVFVHSVKVIEHFYRLNDASAVFSN